MKTNPITRLDYCQYLMVSQTNYTIRWKIEQFHREIKQLTGIESNQCRKARIQRNHIACSILVWISLNRLAKQLNKSMYHLKQGLLDAYLCEQLRSLSLRFA